MTTLEAGICTLCGIGGGCLAVLFWIGDSLHTISLRLGSIQRADGERVVRPFRGLRRTEEARDV